MSTLPPAGRPTDPWGVARRTVALVNLQRTGALDDASLRTTLAAWGDDVSPTTIEVRATAGVLDRLAEILTTVDVDTAAAGLNSLLARWCGPPRLVRHDGWPWHLHVDDDDDAALDRWIGASGAFALASLLAGRTSPPWGSCAAPGCSRVFVHDERGARRRYCSTTCGTRVRVARHRAHG